MTSNVYASNKSNMLKHNVIGLFIFGGSIVSWMVTNSTSMILITVPLSIVAAGFCIIYALRGGKYFISRIDRMNYVLISFVPLILCISELTWSYFSEIQNIGLIKIFAILSVVLYYAIMSLSLAIFSLLKSRKNEGLTFNDRRPPIP